MIKPKLVVIDRYSLNAKIIEAIHRINPTLRLACGRVYYPDLKDPDDFLGQRWFSVIEAKQKDSRPRSRFLNLPIGKLPPTKVLLDLGLEDEVSEDLEANNVVVMTSYGDAGRIFADQLSDKLIEAGLSVVLYVKHYDDYAQIHK